MSKLGQLTTAAEMPKTLVRLIASAECSHEYEGSKNYVVPGLGLTLVHLEEIHYEDDIRETRDTV